MNDAVMPSLRQLKVLSALLGFMLLAVIVATGVVYYFKIDYFLPPALVLVMIPLITQLHAALSMIKRQHRLTRLKERAKRIEGEAKYKHEE